MIYAGRGSKTFTHATITYLVALALASVYKLWHAPLDKRMAKEADDHVFSR